MPLLPAPSPAGHVTLELSKAASRPMKLGPGRKIGQICVVPLSSAAEARTAGPSPGPATGPARPDSVPLAPALQPRHDALTGGATVVAARWAAPREP